MLITLVDRGRLCKFVPLNVMKVTKENGISTKICLTYSASHRVFQFE